MSDHVVVDASVAVKWLVREPHSEEALELLASWAESGLTLVAPHLLAPEVTNALHRRVVDGELTVAEASGSVDLLLSSGIQFQEAPGIHVRALELASALEQGAVYDVHYLALAEALECDLWTADRRFHRAVGTTSGRVRWIGEATTADAP